MKNMQPLTEILFEGRKTFWKTKSTVNILLVKHHLWDIVEVVAFDPVSEIEAPRIYINCKTLEDLIAPGKASSNTIFSSLFKGFHPAPDKQMIIDFLLNHLFIAEYLPVSKVLRVAMRSSFVGEDGEEMAALFSGCDIPGNFVAYPYVPRAPITRSCLEAAAAPKSNCWVRDKLRIPLIFGKLTRGLSLSEDDQRIWIEFSKTHSQEDLLAHTAEALATSMPEVAPIIQSALNAAALPEQCPFPDHSMCGPRESAEYSAKNILASEGGVDKSDNNNAIVLKRRACANSPLHKTQPCTPTAMHTHARNHQEPASQDNSVPEWKEYKYSFLSALGKIFGINMQSSSTQENCAFDCAIADDLTMKPTPMMSASPSTRDLSASHNNSVPGNKSIDSFKHAVGALAMWRRRRSNVNKVSGKAFCRVIPAVLALEEGDCESSVQSG